MGNKYTTVDLVESEIPGSLPESLDEDKITQYIEDASRYVDARLPNYSVFADIESDPPTPPVIEKITRLIAAHDCLVYAGIYRGDNTSGNELRDIAEKMIEQLFGSDETEPRAMLDPSEYDYSALSKREAARQGDSSRPGSIYRADISRRDTAGGDVEDL